MGKLKATLHMKKNSAENFVFHRTSKIKGPLWHSTHRNRTQPVDGKESHAWLTNDFAWYWWPTRKWTAAAPQTSSGHSWRTEGNKPLQWAEVGAVHLSIHFARRTNDQTCKEILIHGSGHYLAAIVRDMKEPWLEDPSQWHLGRSLLDISHSMGKLYKDICVSP